MQRTLKYDTPNDDQLVPREIWRRIIMHIEPPTHSLHPIIELHILRFVCKVLHRTVHALAIEYSCNWGFVCFTASPDRLLCGLRNPFTQSPYCNVVEWMWQLFIQPYIQDDLLLDANQFCSMQAAAGHLDALKYVTAKNIFLADHGRVSNIWTSATRGGNVQILDHLLELHKAGKCYAPPSHAVMLVFCAFYKMNNETTCWWRAFFGKDLKAE